MMTRLTFEHDSLMLFAVPHAESVSLIGSHSLV